MSVEKIPLPKDETACCNLFCCFPTRSWSGKRINGYQGVEKSFDERRKIFILGVGNTDKESYQIPPCKQASKVSRIDRNILKSSSSYLIQFDPI